jgi:flagellar protein FliT
MPDDGASLRPRASGAAAVIARYEAIAALSRCMLAAAHAGDWSEVTRLEGRCRELIAELKEVARHARLNRAEQRRRIELLRGILADDAEIRRRAEPWLSQLERLLRPAPRRPGKH